VALSEIDSQPASKFGFQLVDTGSTVLYDRSGTATLPVTVSSTDKADSKDPVTVVLSLSGATVTGVVGMNFPGSSNKQVPTVTHTKDGYQLQAGQAASGIYNFSLANVAPGAMVTVIATGNKPFPGSICCDKAVKTGSLSHTFVAMPAPSAVPARGAYP